MMTAGRRSVEKKIREPWPDEADGTTALLHRHGDSCSAKAGRARVQLALLKPANGLRDALREYVEPARRDYRDVLALAEFSQEMKSPHLAGPDLSPEQARELEAIRMQDREQYST